MCLLPLPNLRFDSLAYKKGVREFDCGACPECLSKRANHIVLRDLYESKEHSDNCMVTLTYDSFLRDVNGNIVYDKYGRPLENPVDPDRKVCKRHIQLFIKRLRKWWSTVSDTKIKYRVCAEYGSKTHRAHYHAILFGVRFNDLHYYKKSKRGNIIYMSERLSSLWSYGICTVDSISIRSSIARYCSKYVSKQRSSETFMLCSQGIGLNGLLRDFNGINYMIDGREYTVPRSIWEHYIVNKYQKKYLYLKNAPLLSPKYVNRDKSLSDFEEDFAFYRSQKQRAFYRKVRDKDPLYIKYLEYWQNKGLTFEFRKLTARQRILQLSDSKYHFYKVAALECLDKRRKFFVPYVAPGSGCITAFFRHYDNFFCHLPPISRLNRASDTIVPYFIKKGFLKGHFLRPLYDNPPLFIKNIQLSLDF